MNLPVPSFSEARLTRRHLLQAGGVLSLGALISACGSNRGGSDNPGRLGVAPPPATLPAGTVDELALVRTGQSIEHTLVAVYDGVADAGVWESGEQALADRLVADHTAHAALFGELASGLGGEPYACANPFVMDRAVNPILELIAESDDKRRDVRYVTQAFESWAGASHQAIVAMRELTTPEVRRAFAQVCGEDNRHAAVLARAINDQTFGPSFFGLPVEKDGEGFFVPYAIPSVFGRVAGIDLVVGNANDEGTRFQTQLQTPAANSIIYDYQSC